jgi:hypothetical protein
MYYAQIVAGQYHYKTATAADAAAYCCSLPALKTGRFELEPV